MKLKAWFDNSTFDQVGYEENAMSESRQAGTGASSLHELLSRSPLNRLEFESESVKGPVREVEL